MFLTNGQLFLNLDKLIDVDSVLKLKPWLSAFVARHFDLLQPPKYYHQNLLSNRQGVLDLANAYVNAQQIDQDLLPLVNQLRETKMLTRWIMLQHDVEVGGFIINVRPWPKGQAAYKHLSSYCQPIPQDAELAEFYQWLDQQTVFAQYGSVRFFVNFQHTATVTHTDVIESNKPSKEEFIWLGFSPHKHLYIFDPESQTKVYATGIANYFNTANWHGSDPVKQCCYSIRVDGIFSDQFKQRMAASQRPS